MGGHGRVGGHAQGEAGLARARPAPDDDEVGRLEAGQLLVEVDEAGGDAGDGLVVLEQGLEVVEVGAEEVAQGRDGVGDPLLGHVEDEGLGLVDGPRDVVGQAVADLGDVAGDGDEAAEEGVLLDDAGVAAGVADGRGARLQGDEDGRAPHRLQQVGPGQLVGHRDRVGRLALGVEGGDGVVDVAVGRLVEVVGVELDLDRGHDGVAAEEHGAEQGLLGLEVVGRDAGPRRGGVGGRAPGAVADRLGADHLSHGGTHHAPERLETTSAANLWISRGGPRVIHKPVVHNHEHTFEYTRQHHADKPRPRY